jgi:large subunit ribosomal protein L24
MSHVKKDDTVVVITGKYAGETHRKVLAVEPKKNRVVVDGVNVVKRASKPRNSQLPGTWVEKTLPINISNVMLVCPKCNKPTRAAMQVAEDGTRSRICRRCKEQF